MLKIVRRPNRQLWCTSSREPLNFLDIRELILGKIKFKITCAVTGKDLTQNAVDKDSGKSKVVPLKWTKEHKAERFTKVSVSVLFENKLAIPAEELHKEMEQLIAKYGRAILVDVEVL